MFECSHSAQDADQPELSLVQGIFSHECYWTNNGNGEMQFNPIQVDPHKLVMLTCQALMSFSL